MTAPAFDSHKGQSMPKRDYARVFGLRLVCETGIAKPTPKTSRIPLRGPRDVYAHVAGYMEELDVEHFCIIALDSQHNAIYDRPQEVTTGILNSSLVHPREVFRRALAANAAAIILVHNHPSGDPTPSADDRAVTKQLVNAGRLLDIPVRDHVIVGAGRYVSLAELGLI